MALPLGYALLSVALPCRSASAHVAPSATENNRYLKLTLLPDRVRCSYTVFFGDRPGAGERLRMDRNHDGAIDEAEARGFGEAVRDDVAGHLRLVVDGTPVPPSAWRVEDVGLGTPVTTGGAFAVDLLAYAPTRGAGAHALTLEDAWKVPDPGETEIRVDESPGVRAVASHLVIQAGGNQLRWAFRGNPDQPAERAIRADWTVDAAAHAQATAAASAPPSAAEAANVAPAHRSRRLLWIALGLSGLGAAALAVLGLRRAKTTA